VTVGVTRGRFVRHERREGTSSWRGRPALRLDSLWSSGMRKTFRSADVYNLDRLRDAWIDADEADLASASSARLIMRRRAAPTSETGAEGGIDRHGRQLPICGACQNVPGGANGRRIRHRSVGGRGGGRLVSRQYGGEGADDVMVVCRMARCARSRSFGRVAGIVWGLLDSSSADTAVLVA